MTFKEDILEDLNQSLKLQEDSREAILQQLALKDAKIDKIDALIVNIDKKIPPLIDEINSKVTALKAAYDARIAAGCRSDLKWEITESTTNLRNGTSYTVYTCIKNNTRTQKNFYGQKYYRKPLNRDFGSNVITELTGNIVATGITIAVTSVGGTDGVQVGDLVTDNLDGPTIFSIGSLPKVTGFGTTDVIGFTTTITGNIGVGSDHFVQVGSGSTLSAAIGSAVSFTNVLPAGTTVIGFGTANATVPFYDATAGTTTNTIVTRPSLILSNVATAATVNGTIHIGESNNRPTLLLDQGANSLAVGQQFTVIRSTADIDSDFDFEKSPIDPITIGIIGTQSGIGHKSEIVNNGFPSGPVQWHEQRQDPEPSIGAGNVVYYTGTLFWPAFTTGGSYGGGGTLVYATEGDVIVSSSSTLTSSNSVATVTSIPPPGSETGAACVARATTITDAESALTSIINTNLPEINRLNDLSSALRRLRDDDELQAYGMLQGAAYTRGEANQKKNDIQTISGSDLSEFEP